MHSPRSVRSSDGVPRTLPAYREAVLASLVDHSAGGCPAGRAVLLARIVSAGSHIVRRGWRDGWSPDQCGAVLARMLHDFAESSSAPVPGVTVH